MRRQVFLCAGLAACSIYLVFLQGSASAAVPPDQIAFQGRLLDDSGLAIPEGSRQIYFQIFDAETGGAALWSENQSVSIGPDGYYTAYLGRKNPLGLPFDQAYWLQAKVEDDPPMVPRFPLKKAAYAFRADEAATVSDLSVTTSKIVNQAVTAIKIAANAVTSAKISDGSIVNSDISPTAAISSNKIDDGPGSGLDADTVDGQHASAFAPTSHDHFGDSWSGSDIVGLHVIATDTSAKAIYGTAGATTGLNYGGHFVTYSTLGRGVRGYALAETGVTYGGHFESNSTSGSGVYAEAPYRGVEGQATASSGLVYGGYFSSASTSGGGVSGHATGSSGTTYGGLFRSSSTSGRAVYAYANATSGNTYGIKTYVLSPSGYAGYFQGGHGVHVVGNLSCTGTKPFIQEHPTDPTKEIVYTAIESPEAATYIRGTAELVDGKAEVELPEHFSLVTNAEGITVSLTPVGGWLQLYVEEKTSDHLLVREASGKSGEFDYLVQGVRKGYEDYQVVRDRSPEPKAEELGEGG